MWQSGITSSTPPYSTSTDTWFYGDPSVVCFLFSIPHSVDVARDIYAGVIAGFAVDRIRWDGCISMYGFRYRSSRPQPSFQTYKITSFVTTLESRLRMVARPL